MWGGGTIGVRFSGGSDNVAGSLDFFWGVQGMSPVSDVTTGVPQLTSEPQKRQWPRVSAEPKVRGDARKAGR